MVKKKADWYVVCLESKEERITPGYTSNRSAKWQVAATRDYDGFANPVHIGTYIHALAGYLWYSCHL